MSYELLKLEIIDTGLCQGCELCVGSCKHIEMVDMLPALKDYCILERDGIDCGKCYQVCPQVIQKDFEAKEILAIYSLRSKNPEILAKASSRGFVTTITKELLENQTLSEIVMVQKNDEFPIAESVADPNEIVKNAGAQYRRSGVLRRLVELTGETFNPIGIVGVSCEMRGAAKIEEAMNREILKIGLFCSSQIHPEKRCGCTLLGEAHSDAVRELKKSFLNGELEFQEDLQDGKRCESCKQHCKHCLDFAAIYSDITAGEAGSIKGYTTVVAWTERGKEKSSFQPAGACRSHLRRRERRGHLVTPSGHGPKGHETAQSKTGQCHDTAGSSHDDRTGCVHPDPSRRGRGAQALAHTCLRQNPDERHGSGQHIRCLLRAGKR